MKKIFFMHIPKTAGTSLRCLFYNNFKEANCYPNTEAIKNNNNNYPNIKHVLFNKNIITKYNLFFGHYPFLIANKIYPFYYDVIKIAFMRNPLKRSLSLLQHFIEKNDNFKNKTIEEILENKRFVDSQLFNTQTYYFSAKNFNTNNTVKNINLNRAKKNLNKFDLIGFTENYNESVKKIADLLNFKNIAIKTLNRSKSRVDTNKKIINKILPLIELDMDLYNYARERHRIN